MMTDIHTHTNFGVDDGARSFEMSCEMIRRAAAQGVSRIVCTSHISPGLQPFPMETYTEHLYRLANWTIEENIGIQLYGGSEIFYTESTPDALAHGIVPTIGGTWNTLVEFNPSVPLNVMTKAFRDIGNRGFNIVLAHAERYDCVHKGNVLASLKDEYMLTVQMNCNTVLHTKGWRGDRWARHMLADGIIDVVASDAHNLASRACRMREAYDLLCTDLGKSAADLLCTFNPNKLLEFHPV